MKTITNQSAKEIINWLEDYKTKLSGTDIKILNEKRKINKTVNRLKNEQHYKRI